MLTETYPKNRWPTLPGLYFLSVSNFNRALPDMLIPNEACKYEMRKLRHGLCLAEQHQLGLPAPFGLAMTTIETSFACASN